ncbi:CD1375 family protein [Lactobacillus hominis]|uniref:CD1375 family protein n=1 Tax=Lactobacillus hominis TaxID=1203033 RepID=UPI0023F287ED|nr:CD1375 family protein [Lactobacillus hominis]
MEKPSVRTIDYVVLVQSSVMSLDEVPQDIQEEVARWLSFFVSGIEKTKNKDVTEDDQNN